MHFSLSTFALTLLTLTSTTTALPPTAYRIPMRNAKTDPTNPALSWHVSDFDIGCSMGGCVYNFAIQGFASQNTPGFNTTCNGTTEHGDYVACRNKGVLAQVDPAQDGGEGNWTVKAEHTWREGAYSAFYAFGEKNVTDEAIRFTIPVKEASILRQIVAGPRLQHPETGLDLCYVADNTTSGPSTNYPKIAYRTPLKQLVSFLDSKHGDNWCIWEFRAEGTGYPDSEVYGRIHHFPFPDHHPPPFAQIPKVMASMRNWLQRMDRTDSDKNGEGDKKKNEKGQRIAVVHCKAGKGRSGSMACSYLISQEGWKMEDALQRFTERRMRVGFGEGVSIPSQLRWVRYVNRWTNEMGKKYVERPVEILEIHVWGLRDGVKVAVEGFVEDGQKIKQFHLFHHNERIVMPGDTSQSNSTGSSDDGDGDGNGSNGNSKDNSNNSSTGNLDKAKAKAAKLKLKPKSKSKSKLNSAAASASASPSDSTLSTPQEPLSAAEAESNNSLFTPNPPAKANTLATSNPTSSTNTAPSNTTTSTTTTITAEPHSTPQKHTSAVLLRPSHPLILPTSDINIDFERRSKAASYTGLPMVTSIAHAWFNPYFEGGDSYDSGVFEVEWDAMDGIKGTSRKGIKALDRLKVLWRYAGDDTVEVRDSEHQRRPVSSGVVVEPGPGEEIPETRVRDWKIRESETEREMREGESSADEEGVKGTVDREEVKENVPLKGKGEDEDGRKRDGDGEDKGKDKAAE
ncbi:hypothetical protein BDV06DRAFT_221156 [Aspergillus oleicola]